jgi:hypothetical protein
MTHPETIFVSDDARLRDGKLDPTDEEIMRQAANGGKVFHMNSEEALAMVEAQKAGAAPQRRFSAVQREVKRTAMPPPAGANDKLIELDAEQIHDLVGASAETWAYFRSEARRLMTDDRAAYVRRLRVDRKYTWRSVARACSNAWRLDWGSNQIAGMSICEAAAERLFEHYRKPPWN